MSGTNPAGRQGPEYHQHNAPTSGGTVYSHQGSGSQVVHNTYTDQAAQRRRQTTTRLLIGALLADILYFFYGMWSYSGHNTSGDAWRAGIYLVMLVITIRLIRRWFRQRA
jgi:hypothetical protein